MKNLLRIAVVALALSCSQAYGILPYTYYCNNIDDHFKICNGLDAARKVFCKYSISRIVLPVQPIEKEICFGFFDRVFKDCIDVRGYLAGNRIIIVEGFDGGGFLTIFYDDQGEQRTEFIPFDCCDC